MGQIILMGKSDAYCICKIGKKVKTQTKQINDNLHPMWEHSFIIEDYSTGQDLTFEVWDKDIVTSDALGSAVLKYDMFKAGSFEGELRLTGKAAENSILKVKVRLA